MASININGVELEYESVGQESDPAILLVMGLGAQLTLWPDELCETLAASGFRVIRFDNRDVGLSSKLDAQGCPNLLWQTLRMALKLRVKAPYSLHEMADDAVGLLDGLGIDRAHVVGASMGGMIAQLLTANHSARVRSLTSIMSTTADPKLPRADRKVTNLMFFGRPKGKDPTALVDHGMRVWTAIGSPGQIREEADLRDVVTRQIERNYSPHGFVRQTAAVMATGSLVEHSERIARPTLVIHGTADPLVPIAHGRDTAARVPGARFEAIEGMGHDMPPALIPRLSRLIIRHVREADVA